MKNWIISTIVVLSLAVAFGCGGPQPGKSTARTGNMPQDGTFDGIYQSPAWGRLEITVDGSNAVGLFESDSRYGRMEGTVTGDLYKFRWTSTNTKVGGKVADSSGNGYFKYVVTEEGTTKKRMVHWVKGEWGYGEDDAGKKWDAVKLQRAKKRLKPISDKGPTTMMDDDFATSAGFGATPENEKEVGGMAEPEPEKDESEDDDDTLDGLF
jgi:hypothetical protein